MQPSSDMPASNASHEFIQAFRDYYRRTTKGGEYTVSNDPEFVVGTAHMYYKQIAPRVPDGHHLRFIRWLEVERGWVPLDKIQDAISHYTTDNVIDLQQARKDMGAFRWWLDMRTLAADRLVDTVGWRATRSIRGIAAMIVADLETREEYQRMSDDSDRRKAFWRWCHNGCGLMPEAIVAINSEATELDAECQRVGQMNRADRLAHMRRARQQIRTTMAGRKVAGFNAPETKEQV